MARAYMHGYGMKIHISDFHNKMAPMCNPVCPISDHHCCQNHKHLYASQTDSSQKIHSHLNSHVESLGKLSNVRRRATPLNLGALKLKGMLQINCQNLCKSHNIR